MKYLLPILLSLSASAQTIIYVDKDAPVGGDGNSWETAYKYLNDALVRTQDYAGSEPTDYPRIWIAEGTYYTDEDEGGGYINDDPSIYFNFKYVSAIIGGFSGFEASEDQSNKNKYLTRLSGLIYNEYDIYDIGSNQLLYIEANTSNGFLLKNLFLQNKSTQYGSVLSVSGGGYLNYPIIQIDNCSFNDSYSISSIINASRFGRDNNILFWLVEFRNCEFKDNRSDASLIDGGNFKNCWFSNNICENNLINAVLDITIAFDACYFGNNHTEQSLVSARTAISNTVFFRNYASLHILGGARNQLRNITYVDNYTNGSIEISGAAYLENCIFFRSGLNSNRILSNLGSIGSLIESDAFAPLTSAFFGVASYGAFASSSTSTNNRVWFNPFRPNTEWYTANYSYIDSFMKKYLVSLSGNTIATSIDISDFRIGTSSYNYSPDILPYLTESLDFPNPFVNHLNPLGDDGIPFTEDDGLRLDPDSPWASEAINIPTIDYNYATYDILGNDRIIGGKIDLGAYEYKPSIDSDGDGVSDSIDAFANDSNEFLDTDGDNIGNNEDEDDDGDGISDIVEIAAGLDPLQFDSTLSDFIQSLSAGQYTESDITNARLSGQSDVTSNPSSYNLYTETSIMDMNFGGLMIQRNDNGKMEVSYTIETSEDLTSWSNHSQPTIELTPQTSKQFVRLRIGE